MIFQKALNGLTFVSNIAPSVVDLENEYGKLELGLPTLYITTPVIYEHKIIGVVCMRLDVMEISRHMRNIRLGETGETYLINSEGYMISESKYLKQIKDMGLVHQRTTLELKVVNPKTKKLTRSAEACIKGEKRPRWSGLYRLSQHRGFGLLAMDTGIGLGVIAEIDMHEGYGPCQEAALDCCVHYVGDDPFGCCLSILYRQKDIRPLFYI